ncbi:unnamed protein product [Boreogadus saida]
MAERDKAMLRKSPCFDSGYHEYKSDIKSQLPRELCSALRLDCAQFSSADMSSPSPLAGSEVERARPRRPAATPGRSAAGTMGRRSSGVTAGDRNTHKHRNSPFCHGGAMRICGKQELSSRLAHEEVVVVSRLQTSAPQTTTVMEHPPSDEPRN